jgi:hypothetical protein
VKTYRVKLTFKQPLLGTVPKDREVYATYIAGKADISDEQREEEMETVEHLEEKGWTGFHTDEEGPFVYDYAVKGFFKDACSMLRRVKGNKSAKITAYKKIIDGLIFVDPRCIHLQLPDGEEMALEERPLRAQTAQGERISLVRSDAAPPGTVIEFEVEVLDDKTITEEVLREWFDYGRRRGMGQWRNSGMGAFEYEMESL